MEKGVGGPVAVIARQRLARLLLDRGRSDEALQLLDAGSDITGFESSYAESRGDILAANDDYEGANEAYQQALDTMEAGTGNRELIQLKMANLDNSPAPETGNESES